ncbi:MAG: DNA polymerase III subunit delta [Acidimicrobiales bacterium]
MAGEEGSAGRAAWLVQGGDETLVSEAVRGLIDELVGDGDRTLMVEDFRGDEVDLAIVADAARTPPFLAERRVLVVRDVTRFTTEELAPLLAYLDDPLPSTALVLVGGEGRVAPKLLSAVKAHGHVVSTSVSSREAYAWMRERIHAAPVRLDAATASRVEAHLGEDVGRLPALLDMLVAVYGEGARLGPDDVEPYLGEAGSVTPWDFTDAIDAGKSDVALRLLHRMLGAGERHPLVVLATLHRHVQSLLRVQSPEVTTEAKAASVLGIAAGRSTYPAKKALASARRLGPDAVVAAVGLVADAELSLKGAQDWPPVVVLEVLVARLCQLARMKGRRG